MGGEDAKYPGCTCSCCSPVAFLRPVNYDTSRRTYPDAVAPPPQAVAPEAPKTAQSHKAKPAPSQTAKPTSKDQQKKSEPKVHTLDQEYHLKESNSDTVMEKDEQWVRKERREKSSEA